MEPTAALIIFGVGFIAGIFNSVVGFGTSITFPALVLLGYPPLVSNTSNKVGLLPGILTGIAGYRRELAGQRSNILLAIGIGLIGGVGGGLLLIALPKKSFSFAAPIIILLSTALFIAQPFIARHARRNREQRQRSRRSVLVAIAGALYGGYFGAGQGVIYIAALSSMLAERLQRIVALKNVLGAVVTASSSALFLAVAHVDYLVALFLATGSVGGGYLGAVVGRRLPETALRAVVIVVSVTAAIVLFL